MFAPGTALLLLSGLAVAQPPPRTLTLEDCIGLASAAQSSVTIARRQAEISRLGITQARAGFLPQARVSNGFTYNSPLLHDRGTFSFIPLDGIREYASVFTTGVELDSSGKLRAELARAQAERRSAAAGVRLSERELKRAVTAAYLRVLLARHILEVSRASLSEAQNFEKRVRLLFENGEAAQADVAKAAAQTAFLEQSVNAAELDARLANQELASFWTTAADEPLWLADVLADPVAPPAARDPGKPFLHRPEFDLLEAQRQAALAESRRARAELFPQLGLVFQYGLDSTHVRWADRGYATFLTLNVPVFDWLKAHSAARQSQLRAAQVEASRAMAERGFSKEYESALARVRLIYQQIAMTESQVKASEENLRLSRLRYEGGEGSALEVVTAQAQLTQARSNYYSVVSAYLNAKADLEVASGQ